MSPVRLADLHPDDTDRLLLTIARHFFHEQTVPDRGYGRAAITLAEIAFGYGRGAAIAAAMQHAIDAMRISRRDAVRYHSPDCPNCAGFLTEAELLFVQTFRSVRTGLTSAASANAMLLCEGNDYVPFLDAVARLFRVFSGARWQCETETWLTG